DDSILKDELVRTGYYGQFEPGHIKPAGYVELHVEQGPVLDHEGYELGAVTGVQGINWQKLVIEGAQNHAGTTPTYLRKDAGLAAAKITTFLRERAIATNDSPEMTVTTVGSISFSPNLINVIPQTVEMTVDIRNANKEKWLEEDEALHEYIKVVEKEESVTITTERLAYFEPVPFDDNIIGLVESSAKSHDLNYRRIVSGAGHDAQM
ncbi:MAG: M20/M25/M40 family metallo-hydrolase, partial [Gallicola sp.]|nr:M20/M25/M40 family metallo-hydrolase [Gallicola sp.]